MFERLTRRWVHRPYGLPHRDLCARGRRRDSWDCLEPRTLLTVPPISLISENYAGTNSAAIGALFPSISANGQYVTFESGSFQGNITPAPSDLVQSLTVENDAPNVYFRNLATNTTICISVNYQTGNTTGNNDSRYPIISANGNTVVFLSNATDLTANDNPSNNSNNDQNVFAWNRLTGKVTLVTVNYEGTGPANDPNPQYFGTAENISVSANGEYVAYDSEATDLVAGVTNNNYTANVYVRDLLTNTTILVSRNVAGTNIGDGPSNEPVISADGSTVAFDSLANNLDAQHNGGAPFENYQVYASTLNYTNDTVSTTNLLSISPTGTSVGNGTSIAPSLSDNGRMVAFQSSSSNLVNTPNGGSYNDVYVRNLGTSTTQLVSINDTNTATGNSSSFAPQISGDGNHVLFYSLANNLTTNDTVGSGIADEDVFERNLTTNTTQLVSINSAGTNNGNNTSRLANQTLVNASQQATGQISDNGQYVIFYSVATDLVPNFVQNSGGSPFGYDVYLRDTVAGATTLISHAVGLATSGGTGESGTTAMTPDGLNIVFQSAFPNAPDNLVSNDTYGQTQLFHVDLAPLVATAITATAGTPQSALVNTAFATALQAKVTDQNGNPLSGVTVTFAAPTTGVSGKFTGGLTTVTASTNASGLATAPTFTANGTAGSYSVTASVSGVATPATFSLTNTAAVVPTSITAVSGTGTYGGTATLTATLTANNTPLAGKSIAFTLLVGGTTTPVGSATTGANGVATLAGVSLTGFSAGTANGAVGASFAGDAGDQQSSSSGNLTVNQATPVITWGNPADITYGTPLSTTQLDATASVPGQFVYSPLSGTVLSGGNGQTLSVTFTPTDQTDYKVGTAQVTINVDPATPAFTALASPTISPGTASTVLSGQITAGTLIPTGNVSITLNGVTEPAPINAATGAFFASFSTAALGTVGSPYAITYAYAGNANYSAVNGSGTLTVSSQVVTPTTPNAPVLAAASNTGGNGLTKDNGSATAPLMFNVSGVGPANGYVQLYDDTNPSSPVPLGFPVQASGGNATVTLAGGTNLPLPDGVREIAAASEATDGGTPSALSSTTNITVQSSVTITASNPANGGVVSALPGGQVTLTFSHPLAGLTNGGPALGASDPYGIFLLARGPAGQFSAPGTSAGMPGYYTGNLPLHATTTYVVNANGTSSIVITPTVPLSTDVYLISITLSDFSDLAGNTLTDPGGGGYRSFLLQLPPSGGTPFGVTKVTINNGATTVANNAIAQPDTLAIGFNRPLYPPSVNSNNVQLLAKTGSSYTVVPSVPAYSPTTDTIYLTPTATLVPGTVYLIRVAGKDTPTTPAANYVSDDQGYASPGFPLGATFYDTFTVKNASVAPGSGPLKVATGAGGAPATLPSSNVIWTQPMGYASIGFTEALNLSTVGRYSVMLVPESLPPTVAPLAPNIPLNTSLAFNPNTNQLIIVPTAPTGNNLLYVYVLQGFQGHDGSPLLNNAGQPAGVSGNAPYFQTFELATGASSHAVVRPSVQEGFVGIASAATPAVSASSLRSVPSANAVAGAGSRPREPLDGPRRTSAGGVLVSLDLARGGRIRFSTLRRESIS
ncbi:MAG: hypothetical protein P4L84_37350 [Isosphaeraceae bacterium]|nr:hypothetical protein [Isosphaeraceae bacterium]